MDIPTFKEDVTRNEVTSTVEDDNFSPKFDLLPEVELHHQKKKKRKTRNASTTEQGNIVNFQGRTTLVEICVDSLESAIAAKEGGADQIEVCSALSEGGLTPSAGLVAAIARAVGRSGGGGGGAGGGEGGGGGGGGVRVAAMIRPRAGDFCYTAKELQVMKSDIQFLKEAGADSFVFGTLSPDGSIDMQALGILMQAAGGAPVCFHRAFDAAREGPGAALRRLAGAGAGDGGGGVARVLTSGRAPAAPTPEGKAVLAECVRAVTEQSSEQRVGSEKDNAEGKDGAMGPLVQRGCTDLSPQLLIMAGAGLNEMNVKSLILETGVHAVHIGSGVTEVQPSKMAFKRLDINMASGAAGQQAPEGEFTIRKVSALKVAKLIEQVRQADVERR